MVKLLYSIHLLTYFSLIVKEVILRIQITLESVHETNQYLAIRLVSCS